MPDVSKLKKKAAELELKKQFDKALAVYVEILDSYAGSKEEVDVALFNRVGDIYLKQGNVADAVEYYEKAVDHYVDNGFFNNAIALCNKILRASPGRATIYYKLGKISAHKGFKGDAKANYLEYADRMQKSGKINEAFRALKEFADLCPDQDDIRLMLADQLQKAKRGEEAIEQLQLLYERYMQDGREAEAAATVQRMRAIDPATVPREPGTSPRRNTGDLVFLDLGEGDGGRRRADLARRATQGLNIIATGEQPKIPARPAAPPAKSNELAFIDVSETPVRPAAPVPEPVRKQELEPVPELMAEPASPTESFVELETVLEESPEIAPAVLDGMTRAIEFESLSEPPATGLLEGIQSTGFDDEASYGGQGRMIDLETTGFGSTTGAGADFGSSLLDMDDSTLGGGFADAGADAPGSHSGAPNQASDSSLLDFEGFESGTAERPADEAPIGGDLDLMMPEADAPRTATHDLPMMDLDLPAPGEAMAAITGGDAASGLEILDLGEPARTPANDTPPPAPTRRAPYAARPKVAPEPPTRPEPVFGSDASSDLAETLASATLDAAHSVESLQRMVAGAPEDHALRRRLAETMLDSGDRDGGIRELEAAMVGHERGDDLDSASGIADEIVRLNPDSLRYHQKRVEYAFRLNERGRLIEAYLELADALFRAAHVEKSRAIYQRVLDLAPDDIRARAALESFPSAEPASPAAAPAKARGAAAAVRAAPAAPARRAAASASDEDFVNLGDWLRDEQAPKDTRMVVAEQEPSGDEEADFQDMLRKFKQGIAENVEEEDHQAHYDLGVAYKEMGLTDEAIAEFQKALRAPVNRVPAYEALGQCFMEKEQYPMAATVLSRALHEKGTSDDQLVGVLYLLGRCAEARGQNDAALEFYQRVFVVDIQFRDVGDRLAAVS